MHARNAPNRFRSTTAVELAAAALDAADRQAADAGAVERFEDVLGLLGPTVPITSLTRAARLASRLAIWPSVGY
jgi:hypothetical protein